MHRAAIGALLLLLLLGGCRTWSSPPGGASGAAWNPPQLGIEAEGICVSEPSVCDIW